MQYKQKMMFIDSISIVHKNKDGKVLSSRTINNSPFHRLLCKLGLRHNSMTINGLVGCAGLIGNTTPPASMNYVGIGTGTVAASSTDVWLGSATTCQSASSISKVTTAVANDTLQLIYTFGSTGGGGSLTGTSSVSEVIAASGSGTTGSSASGTHTAFLRQVYSPVDVCQWTQGDTLQVTIKLQCKQGA